MNEFAAYPQPVPGGWRVMLRFARDGHPKPVMDKGEKPAIFPTEGEAWQEACRHLIGYMNGPRYRRDGDTIAAGRADAAFPTLKPFTRAKGSGRLTLVERKEARA